MQPSVVFDLDGTILDSAPDIADAVNLLLEHYNHVERLSEQEITVHVGHGARALIKKIWHELGLAALNEAQLDEALVQFQKLYYPICSHRSVLYDGVCDTLKKLHEMGFVLALCTNKPEVHARKIIMDYGLDKWLSFCCGGDTFAVKKPNPIPLLNTISAINSAPSRTYFIGDSEVDHQTAQRAESHFVFLSFGYNNCYQPSEGTLVSHHFADIINHIK